MIDVRTLPGSRVQRLVTDGGYFPLVRPTGPNSALLIMRTGAGHIGITGRLEAISTDDCGDAWSDPVVVAASERDDRSPSIAVVGEKVTVIYLHNGSYGSDGKYSPGGPIDSLVVRSSDCGKTWGDPQDFFFPEINPADQRPPSDGSRNTGESQERKNPQPNSGGLIVSTDDGTLLMPLYVVYNHDATTSESWLLRSSDSGATWGDPTLIAEKFNETALLNLGDSNILATLRHQTGATASVSVSHSSDNGRSWTKPVQVTEESEHPAEIVRLSNGWILMIYSYRKEPYGVQGQISADNGHTWQEEKLLFADHSASEDCGYPSSVVFANGTVITAYYAAGPETAYYDPAGAHCNVVLYSENELIQAVKSAT